LNHGPHTRGRQILRRWPRSALLVCLAAGALAAATPATPRSAADAEAKSFEITASRSKFEPNLIEVREGDHVRITLHSTDTTHGFGIKELNVKTKIPKGGAPVTVEFEAPRAGTYTFACTEYCGSGHRDMKGRLVVAPKSQ
jgi:cytochrome c oxidase subunit II